MELNVWMIYFEGTQIVLNVSLDYNWKKIAAILSWFTALSGSVRFLFLMAYQPL